MTNVVRFPNAGEAVSLYTDSNIYMGTMESSEDFLGRIGIWLSNAQILPIKSKITSSDILRLDSVCVLWDRVVALSPALTFDP